MSMDSNKKQYLSLQTSICFKSHVILGLHQPAFKQPPPLYIIGCEDIPFM